MEAAAYVAGEPFSDHPKCVSPVIGAFMRAWNDALPDEERTALLLPLITKTIGTANGPALEARRTMMAADWLIRTHTPTWLRLAGLSAQADMLASLPEITDMAQVPPLMPFLTAARKDADAAAEASWDAARDAAWTASSAARAAAWTASSAAWTASSAAGAEGDEIATTRQELQVSATNLVERMCEAA